MKEKAKKNLNKKKGWILTGAIFIIIALGAVICIKRYAVDSFTENAFTVYIRPETSYQELLDTLETKIGRSTWLRFRRMANLDDYERQMIPGAYKLDPEMSSVDVYRILSHGLQTPVKYTFNNIRTPEQFAARTAKQLMMDSASVMTLFRDTAFLSELGFDRDNIPGMFLPDSYEFYWTIEPRDLFKKMKKEYDRFWNEERRERAQALGFTPRELTVIASIAEEETNDKKERGTVARLYMNRVQINMPLQADPTVKFALQDFAIRRVLSAHLKYDSPYNTYLYAGLPPGPIRFPSKQTLQAILDSEPNEFLYMCAKEDFSGRHNFTKSFTEHQNNAIRYRKALNARGIK